MHSKKEMNFPFFSSRTGGYFLYLFDGTASAELQGKSDALGLKSNRAAFTVVKCSLYENEQAEGDVDETKRLLNIKDATLASMIEPVDVEE